MSGEPFFAPGVGLFVFTPVALLAVWWMLRCGYRAPGWTRVALLAGLGYELVQLRMNAFMGGGGFYGNRLVIEMVVLSSPLAVASYVIWSRGHPWRRFSAAAVSSLGVATHAFGALLSYYLIGTGPGADWREYYPALVVRHAGVNGLLVALVVIPCLVVYLVHRYQLVRHPAERARPLAPRVLAIGSDLGMEPQDCRPTGRYGYHRAG